MPISAPFRVASILTLGIVLGFGVSVGPTVKAERTVEESPPSPPRDATIPWQDARLLAEVLERIREEYVEEVSDSELIEAAIRGMVADLDPHSAYLDQEQYDEVRISTSGEYSGVGIEVTLDHGVVRVVTAIENTPAARAGVLAGDRIIAVDDVPVKLDTIDDTIERIRGASGTQVKISISRGELVEPLDFLLERANVQVHSVRRAMLEDSIGYVRISHFSDTTTRDVTAALKALQKEGGAPLKGLVLDLRNNPGGVLEAAVGVSDIFLDDGIIVSAVGRAPDAQFEMDARPGDMLDGAPIVVLVNAGSASASEIVAGALRDHRRAMLVGQKTYGKGSVQTVMPLSNGQAIKLTTSRYFTPSGASIHHTGILPDRVVSEEERAIDTDGGEPIFGSLPNDYELRVALSMLAEQNKTIRQSRAH
jgi:carboxyl-terminal processing protease